ncbi:MAG: CocE/NonD family hydrolase, partial [Candidatus Margulisbacteria bacterium]|nr:CocE/NonD family hydrolase [Candidatus Margulisiibacteriota bacterium]
MRNKIIFATSLITLAAIFFVGYNISKSQANDQFPSNEYRVEQAFIPMSDGVRLAATVILPAKSDKARPVIFQYLPYHRYNINPDTGKMEFFLNQEESVKKYIKNGYAFVITDMRGAGASFGNRLGMSPQLGQDGKEAVEWIAAQPWCNGNIGMIGGSYVGWSQYATAGHKPKALKCIMPEIIAFDLYNDAFFAGGIKNRGTIDGLGELFEQIDANSFVPDSEIPDAKIWPTLPVVDEDGDGELADEIPVDVNKSGTFLDDDYPPKYRDGKKRKDNVYYQATAAHKANLTMGEWGKINFRDDIVAGCCMAAKGPNNWPVTISKSGIPVYIVGGWFDLFTRGTFQWFDTLRQTNPCKILIHPSYHAESSGPYWDYFKIDLKKYREWRFNEGLRFFDRYLKGVENGFENDPPIRIYVMNKNEWREEREWPLKRQVITDYYLGQGQTLATQQSTGKTEFKGDLTASAAFGTNKGSRWNPGLNPNTIIVRTEADQKCITFTSAPLTKD